MGPTSREDLPQKLQVVTRLPRKPPGGLDPPELPEPPEGELPSTPVAGAIGTGHRLAFL